MRDASGQMYMRNRYYDPATGQFTQTDPIGLAGGLNAYGFAAGDPVSYSDPYGLCPACGEMGAGMLVRSGISTDRDVPARMGMIRAFGPSTKRTPEHIFGLEYGGEIIEIFSGSNGTSVYTFTGPRTDAVEDGFSPDLTRNGFAGTYHSHGASSFGAYRDEEFSSDPVYGADIEVIGASAQPGYLVTPSGRMLKYDPNLPSSSPDRIQEIGTVPPRPPKP
jgi:hypothetical protein